MRYVYLGSDDTMNVIIAPDLNMKHVECVVEVLKRFKRAIGWTIRDFIGIPPGIFSHQIQLMPGHKPSIQHKIHFNPLMQELVKKEIIKLLDAGVIYPSGDSSWV